MVLWPPSNPTHIILVNEEGTTEPGLQKVDLKTGKATTILTGIDDNDPVRVTPWGTIIFGEEKSPSVPPSPPDPSYGAMYEIIDPLDPALEGTTVDRNTQVFTPPTSKIKRIDAFGFTSYEGLAILRNGVTYYGSEQTADAGSPAGAFYKFVPTLSATTWTPGIPPITSLSQSPYASGKVFALRVGTTALNGQGFQYGTGSWQELVGASGTALRPLALAVKATGYYRPEDLDIDQAALAAGNVRFCGNNTGRDSARYWGETICFTDGTVAGVGRRHHAAGAAPRSGLAGDQHARQHRLPAGPRELDRPRGRLHRYHRRASVRTTTSGTASRTAPDTDTLSDGCIRIGIAQRPRPPSGPAASSTPPARTSTSASSTTQRLRHDPQDHRLGLAGLYLARLHGTNDGAARRNDGPPACSASSLAFGA